MKYLFLHVSFFIFSFSGIFSKLASQYSIFSFQFILYYCLMLSILFIYALLWQQNLKRIELSVAYANKSIMTIWGLIWGVIFFNETLSPKTLISLIFILSGLCFVNNVFPILKKSQKDEESC